jgi:hypothetical protein
MKEEEDDMDTKAQELINQLSEENKKKMKKKNLELQDIYQKLLQMVILIMI